MERKIGEIFEFDGKWYQCVEGRCKDCHFSEKRYLCKQFIVKNFCLSGIIFKKLEKFGEPYEYFVQHKETVMLQPYKLFTTPIINGVVCNVNYDTNTIDLEIKQNKEDMEEYKMHDAKEDIPEFDKVVDECLFGEDKLNLKPFDLQKARKGKPVYTRDGRKARIVCFDREFIYKGQNYCIVALIKDGPYSESLYSYTEDGLFNPNEIHNNDLMMLPEKKEGWVNVYYDNDASSHRGCRCIYDTKEQAIKEAGSNYITTVKINWEE